MKFLITGATGLVGKAVVKEVLKNKHTVHYLTTNKKKIVDQPNYKGFFWNPSRRQLDPSCLEGVDTIIHLAGNTIAKKWTLKYKEKIYESRVDSLKMLYRAIKELEGKHQIKNLVTASAIGCYPSSRESLQTEKTILVNNTFLEYLIREWEKMATKMEEFGIVVVKLRLGLVLSKTGGILKTLKIPTVLGLGVAFGDGKQGQSWIHIDDLVAMFIRFSKGKESGVYNAVSPYPVTQTEFMRSYAKALYAPYFMPPIPSFFVKFLFGDMSILLLDSHWISAYKVRDIGFEFKFKKLDVALADLFSYKR